MLEVGVARAGDGLSSALLRFASFQDPPGGVPATPEAVAFALQFLAHLMWLDVLFGDRAPAAGGAELAVMLTAADTFAPTLVWPRDVPAGGDLGRAFRTRLDALAARARTQPAPANLAARGVVAFAGARAALAAPTEAAPSAPNHI
jgi:hypothetical protein